MRLMVILGAGDDLQTLGAGTAYQPRIAANQELGFPRAACGVSDQTTVS